MSGVYGVAGPGPSADLGGLMDRMARSFQHRPWIATRSTVDHERGTGIGHVGIGLHNAGPQPGWNAQRTVALVMAGELEGVEGDPEATALQMYDAHGPDFAQRLAGAFVIAILGQDQGAHPANQRWFAMCNLPGTAAATGGMANGQEGSQEEGRRSCDRTKDELLNRKQPTQDAVQVRVSYSSRQAHWLNGFDPTPPSSETA